MKSIKQFINKANLKFLKISKNRNYTCQPKTRDELDDIIEYRIKHYGNECDLNDIDVSKIEDMAYLFSGYGLTGFNGHIEYWDVSKVRTMKWMFRKCKNFNCDISNWDVSNVENMCNMFQECESFNQDISRWDVSKVEDMKNMFQSCTNFNQDLSYWDVLNVKSYKNIFDYCPLNNQLEKQPKFKK